MNTIEITNQINELANRQEVTVKVGYYHPIHNLNPITGIVHKGYDGCSGKHWFYIQPLGDNHPGASITKGDIIEFVATN